MALALCWLSVGRRHPHEVEAPDVNASIDTMQVVEQAQRQSSRLPVASVGPITVQKP
jgi:hypothetical protein